jgi:organic hydroperoxide reductase OsmC/OhrA
MLWFLALAAKQKFVVDFYRDVAQGVLEKNAQGKYFMSVVTLRPEVRFSPDRIPSHEQLMALHHRAHEECYIANSVRSEVRCEPILDSV